MVWTEEEKFGCEFGKLNLKRVWSIKHKIGCLNFLCEFHTGGKFKIMMLPIRIED